MEYQTNYSVKITDETKFKNLYKWCIQEFDSDGNQVGEDLIPWDWSKNFKISNMQYSFILGSCKKIPLLFEHDKYRNNSEESSEEPLKIKVSEVILAHLAPEDNGWSKTSYSMIGTNRIIKNIQLRIEKHNEDICYIWGSIRSTMEIDFRDETIEDIIQVYLYLTPKKFDQLASYINVGIVNNALLRLSHVSGFYSSWSPGISTSTVKVLTRRIDEHKLEIPNGIDIDLPRLGTHCEFELCLGNSQKIFSEEESESRDADFEWADKEANEELSFVSCDDAEDERKDDCHDQKFLAPRNDERWADEEVASASSIVSERPELLKQSRKYKLHRQMLRDVSIYAAKKEISQDQLNDLSSEIKSLFIDLEYAFQKDNWFDYENDPDKLTDYYQRSWQLWQHQQLDFEEIKTGKLPYLDRTSLDQAVEHYLNLPIRNKSIDRMLVDALVACELVVFAEEMLYKPSILRDRSTSPFVREHPLWRFLKLHIQSFKYLLVLPVALLFVTVILFELQGLWPVFVGLGFAGLWGLGVIIGLVFLPSVWMSESRKKQKISDLLHSMNSIYNEIGRGNIVSAKYIRERLIKSTEKGAIWPAALYPLLDDIIERNGIM